MTAAPALSMFYYAVGSSADSQSHQTEMTSQTTDFIVIGGGIAGISVAALLSKSASVTVLEAEDQTAYHSTGRSAAQYIRNYGNATLRQLNDLAYPTLSGELTGESVLSARGQMLMVLADDTDTSVDAYLAGASGVEKISSQQACKLVPALKPDCFDYAFYENDASDIDVDRLLQGYVRMVKQNSGSIITKSRVSAISREGNSWTVCSGNQTYKCRQLINAAGAWADQVAQMADLPPMGLTPMRRSAQVFDIDSTYANFNSWPLFSTLAETWYALPTGGRLLISPADEEPVEPQDAWPEDEVLAGALDRFEQMVNLTVGRPVHSWAGLRTFAPDRSPVVGQDPDADGFYWLAGQGGYGIQTAPATAMLLAAQCLDNQTDKDTNAHRELYTALSPSRFRKPGV